MKPGPQLHATEISWLWDQVLVEFMYGQLQVISMGQKEVHVNFSVVKSSYLFLKGIPKLRYTISPIRNTVEVEQVRINQNYLAVLYQIGLVRVRNRIKRIELQICC